MVPLRVDLAGSIFWDFFTPSDSRKGFPHTGSGAEVTEKSLAKAREGMEGQGWEQVAGLAGSHGPGAGAGPSRLEGWVGSAPRPLAHPPPRCGPGEAKHHFSQQPLGPGCPSYCQPSRGDFAEYSVRERATHATLEALKMAMAITETPCGQKLPSE